MGRDEGCTLAAMTLASMLAAPMFPCGIDLGSTAALPGCCPVKYVKLNLPGWWGDGINFIMMTTARVSTTHVLLTTQLAGCGRWPLARQPQCKGGDGLQPDENSMGPDGKDAKCSKMGPGTTATM